MSASYCQEVEVGSDAWNRVQHLVETPELVVTEVHRVHNRALLRRYLDHRDALRREREVPEDDLEAWNLERAFSGVGKPLAAYHDHEALLFHKPVSDRVLFERIVKEGLVAGQSTKCRFGRGIYFSDSLAKCAKYGTVAGDKVLVCLVTLGDCVSAEQAFGLGSNNWNIAKRHRGAKTVPPIKSFTQRRGPRDILFDSWFARSTANEYVVANGMQVFPLYVVSLCHAQAVSQLIVHGSANVTPVQPAILPMPEFIIGLSSQSAVYEYSAWNNAAGSCEASELQLMSNPPHVSLGSFYPPESLLALSEAHHEGMDRLWKLQNNHFSSPLSGNPVFSVELATGDCSCLTCFDQIPQGVPVARLSCCPNAVFHFSPACFSPLINEGSTVSTGKSTVGIRCPNCRAYHGVVTGNCPDGSMHERIVFTETERVICITFDFPAGISPEGQPYPQRSRKAFLPDCAESRAALRNLRTAFELRHCFQLGVSQTTGLYGVVSGSIPFRTSLSPGPYGFPPDRAYIGRLDTALQAALGPFYQSPSMATDIVPGNLPGLEDVLRPSTISAPPRQVGPMPQEMDTMPHHLPNPTEGPIDQPVDSSGPAGPVTFLRNAVTDFSCNFIRSSRKDPMLPVYFIYCVVAVTAAGSNVTKRLVERFSK